MRHAFCCTSRLPCRPPFHAGLGIPVFCCVQGETSADQNQDEFDEDSVVPLPVGTGASLGRFAIDETDEADESEVDDGEAVGADRLPDAPVDGADSSQTGLQRTCSKVRPPS